MNKTVKEVFFNCVNEDNHFCNAVIDEIKFSKKLNAVILNAKSEDNISLLEIEEFERRACKTYELNSFKVDYQFIGVPSEITIKNVQNVILITNKKYGYTQDIFENCKIDINDREKIINIELLKPYSNFLSIKKVDEYILRCLDTQYGKGYSLNIVDSKDAKNSIDNGIKMVRLEDIPNRAVTKSENAEVSKPKTNEVPKEIFRRPQLTEEEKQERKLAKSPQPENVIYGVNIQTTERKRVDEVSDALDRVCIEGQIFEKEVRELKSGKLLLMLDVTDKTSTISCKMFLDKQKYEEVDGKLSKGSYIVLQGRPQIDPFSKEITIMTSNICKGEKPPDRMDNAEEKRVELHLHTQMSAMDAVTSATDLVKQAIKWGHKAVAITDHGVVQSFPEANHVIVDNYADLVKKEGKITTQDILDAAPIKVIYGVEGYLARDVEPIIPNFDTYCVFDLETTGFNADLDGITEVAVCKVKNGEIIDEFTTFVNPEKPIPFKVQELTHITDDMVENAPKMDEVIPKFLEFTKDSVLVAHNAHFDISFIANKSQKLGLEFKPYVIDTYEMSLELYNGVENHKLGTLVEYLGIPLEGAHRAINDTRATAKMFIRMKEDCEKERVDINNYIFTNISDRSKNLPANHIIILAKNYVGLKNLYKLVSYSHVWNFHKRPKISRSMLKRYREGLVIGSACEQGELYQEILEHRLGHNDGSMIEEIANFYDYLEIQPLGNNEFYERIGKKVKKDGKRPKDEEPEYIKLTHQDLIDINKEIVELADKIKKPVVGTCDVHFMNPEDEIYRRIIQAGQGFDDADMQAPLYFRTTEEMLKEFDYLPKEKAYEIVVTNTNLVADWCDRISPISDEKCPPHIEGCEEDIRNIAMEKAHKLYGDPLPEIVQDRLERELNSIISNGYSVMYIIAQRLVWDSNDHGYIVGSRGSVGSSLAAYMTGITEVNSLKSHYRCPNCHYSDFSENGCANGFDLPDKKCPKCGADLDKDGMDIPFETFLGFKGDKEPDIDLNFSGEYQAKAHKYTEVIFGTGTTYKAGTIGTVAEKTAYGFVKNYYEERGKSVPSPEINRISKGCTGIKRTTGQHPGGIIVVPKGRTIYEFCPVQHPADDPYSDIVTTHFDYHSIDKNLLKLDILGHDDPTVIRMLQDITGIDPTKIPLDDKETMGIFSSTEPLGVTPEQIKSEVGTYGVPEFGTKFVRGMLIDTKPTTFEELIRISGLSHGTDVWLNNAQTLIEDGIVTLSEAICTRDDIMIYLINKGLEPGLAFKIMEIVRKGKASKKLTPEMVEEMKKHDVPDWYIDSCFKIKYMFPKAHAAAYVTNAFRIAWFKVHIPKAYYAAFMSIRADEFDGDIMLHGKERVLSKMKEIDTLGNAAQPKDKNMYPILELVLEMNERGIEFLPVDLYQSDSVRFVLEDDGIRPPLSALTGFGEVDAEKVVNARKNYRFTSIEDMQMKSKIGKVAVETLQLAGCLDGMPRSEQMDMFDLL
ncbi:MAG: PolC-type DNA polymerase III [Clostridia bacterium]|nr:PolC-type DNA polymerase III [Clostridia bacterium]